MTEQATIEAVPQLGEGFKVGVIAPGDLAYDDARAVWNGSIDKRPTLIVRPPRPPTSSTRSTTPARRACHWPSAAAATASPATAPSTVASWSISSLKGVHVDPQARTARVNSGVLVGELDRETQLSGLATPSGRVTTTGMGGFTLGGGYRWLSPKFGLAASTCSRRMW